jgi:hypothetical protein
MALETECDVCHINYYHKVRAPKVFLSFFFFDDDVFYAMT